MTRPCYFWGKWPLFESKLTWGIITTQVNSALHHSGDAKSSTSFNWGKGGKVTAAGWQVTLCDPIWHVISHSGEVISITNCYIRVFIAYMMPRGTVGLIRFICLCFGCQLGGKWGICNVYIVTNIGLELPLSPLCEDACYWVDSCSWIVWL